MKNIMKLGQWLDKFGMTALRIKTPYLEMEWAPADADKAAAWELYIELLTRAATQRLDAKDGDEKTALTSIFSLFPITRQIIKSNGKECIEFTKIAIVVLNQIIRPFTSKWHKISIEDEFKSKDLCKQFREELATLQKLLHIYTKMLAEMAGVEDLTELEQ